jgi:predicted SAM-dependent methyltransferase
MKDWVTKYMTLGFKRALGELSREWTMQRKHVRGWRKARGTYAVARNLKLHVGCGSNYKQGWVNIDLFNPTADVALDLREAFPFPDASVSFIYSEHVLEHFEYPRDVRHILQECFRVLAPGGVFSIGVPDHGVVATAYATRDTSFFQERRLRSYLREGDTTLMHHINYNFRQDGLHKYSYDEETLRQILERVGFVEVERRGFDPSLDSAKRNLSGTLYMQARKPSAISAQ